MKNSNILLSITKNAFFTVSLMHFFFGACHSSSALFYGVDALSMLRFLILFSFGYGVRAF